jgi:hypothetical protein
MYTANITELYFAKQVGLGIIAYSSVAFVNVQYLSLPEYYSEYCKTCHEDDLEIKTTSIIRPLLQCPVEQIHTIFYPCTKTTLLLRPLFSSLRWSS